MRYNRNTMIKNKIIVFLAVLTALIPFTGFPSGWRDFFVICLALAIGALAIFIIREYEKCADKKGGVSENNVYVENNPSRE